MSIKKLFDEMTFKEKVVYSYLLLLIVIFGLIFLGYSKLIIDLVVIISPFLFSSILILNFDNFIKNKIENYFYIILFTIHLVTALFIITNNIHGSILDSKLTVLIIISCIIIHTLYLYIIKCKVNYESKFKLFLFFFILFTFNIYLIANYINKVYDYSNKKNYSVYIIEKNIDIAKIRRRNRYLTETKEFYFKINRLNELENLNKVIVNEELYSKKNVLDTLNIELHQGFLKSKWYRVNE